jgi:hypothetical protein
MKSESKAIVYYTYIKVEKFIIRARASRLDHEAHRGM